MTTQPHRSFPISRWSLARASAIATLFLIPISTAGVNITSLLTVLLALTCKPFWQGVAGLRGNRIVVSGIGLFLVLAVSVLWDAASTLEGVSALLKYRKVLFLPFLLIMFDDQLWRQRAMQALFLSLTLVLLLSCTNWLGWTHVGALYAPDPVRASWVFKHHITQSIFTSLLMYMALVVALPNPALGFRPSKALRAVCAAIAALALVNLLVMQQGRTGQVLIVPMLLLWGWQTFIRGHRLSGRAIGRLIGIAVLGAGSLAVVGMHSSSRLAQIGTEVHDYEAHDDVTSVGLRLEFYRRSLLLIQQHPLIGTGVGSVESEFERLTAGHTGAQGMQSANPHNEYLMMTMQAGLLGLAAFIYLLWQLWQACLRAQGVAGVFCSGYVVAFALACLANSLLLDFPEGHMLAFLCGMLLAGAPRTSRTT